MTTFSFPLSAPTLELIRTATPWLQSLPNGDVKDVQALIQHRCEAIKDPWTKSAISSLVAGNPTAILEDSGNYYVAIEKAGPRGDVTSQKTVYLSSPLGIEIVEQNLKRLNLTDPWLCEFLCQCDSFRTSEVSAFADFGVPELLSSYLNEVGMDREPDVFDEGTTHAISIAVFNAKMWICLYYEGNGDVLALGTGQRLVCYLHGINRLVLLPLDIKEIIMLIIAGVLGQGTYDFYRILASLGLSRAYQMMSLDSYRQAFIDLIDTLDGGAVVRDRVLACLSKNDPRTIFSCLDGMIRSRDLRCPIFKGLLQRFFNDFVR